jgi:lipopolysaccharide export system permease protein
MQPIIPGQPTQPALAGAEAGDSARSPGRAEGALTEGGAAVARRPAPSFGVMDVVWFLPRLVLRLFFPKLLDRYVVGEMLGPLLFGWTLFICLFVFSLNLFKLATLLARGARPEAIGELLWLRVVLSSVYCLPMAVLLSGLMAFGRLSGDSELIATQAGGIPNGRPLRNAFILGLLLSILGLAMNEYVIPPAGRRYHFVEEQVKTELKGLANDLLENKAFILPDYDENGKLARLVSAKRYTPEEGNRPATMHDVTYIQYDDKGEWTSIVSAVSAEWADKDKWRFINADTQFRQKVLGNRQMIWHSSETYLTLKKTPEKVAQEQREADEMSYTELKAYIQELGVDKFKNKNRILRELHVELERKLAIPFAALVLAMIGAPLGIRRQRSTAGVGIGLSLLIIILYYMGMSFFGVMGENGQLTPMVAAWGCNVIGLLIGALLAWRAST